MNTEPETKLNRFAHHCVASCQKLLAQIKKTKDNLQAEYHQTVQAHEQLLHLALNEAEALAWETPYPHLVFPALAREKAQAVVAWQEHQRAVSRVAELLRISA